MLISEQFNPIHQKENDSGYRCGPFVAIHKGVISNDMK
jgi:hypothetical protein